MAGTPFEALGTVRGVVAGTTRNGKAKWDVQVEYQHPATGQHVAETATAWEQGTANAVYPLFNQPLVLALETSFSNGREYRNFKGARPNPGGQAPPPMQQQAQQQQGPPPGAQVIPGPWPGAGAGAPGFTPTPTGKDLEIRRGVGLKAASTALSALVGTGYYLDDEGLLDHDKIVTDTIILAGRYARYAGEGPAAVLPAALPAQAQVAEATALPPGVTPEQVAAWAASQGAPVSVGAPEATEATQGEAAVDAAPVPATEVSAPAPY